MPRLARKNIKILGGSATNNGVFGSLQAENPVTTSDVDQLQSLPAWEAGWNAATKTSEKLPPLEEMQAVEYVMSYQEAYLMQEGIAEWNANTTYYIGSLAKEVTASGFKLYYSLADNNTNNQLSDTTKWKKVLDSDGISAPDNKSITFNSSDEFQTVGVINQNDTTKAIKTWTGTRAQYDALVSGNQIDNDTLYNIKDDTYLTQTLLESIYPIGSIYIGTMSTCPLSALFGTWTLVSSGRVLQGSDGVNNAGDTVDAGLPNITGNMNESIAEVTNGDLTNTDGAFSWVEGGYKTTAESVSTSNYKLHFSAQDSNAIYGNSNTVQPPAYIVNIWERTA